MFGLSKISFLKMTGAAVSYFSVLSLNLDELFLCTILRIIKNQLFFSFHKSTNTEILNKNSCS